MPQAPEVALGYLGLRLRRVLPCAARRARKSAERVACSVLPEVDVLSTVPVEVLGLLEEPEETSGRVYAEYISAGEHVSLGHEFAALGSTPFGVGLPKEQVEHRVHLASLVYEAYEAGFGCEFHALDEVC